MYKKTVLDNGLKIVSHAMAQRESLALGIWIKAGGRYEAGSSRGMSHFLEHMLFKGSKRYSCRQIKESIEGIGGVLNGFTSEELTCYLAKIPSRHLAKALDVLSDMVLNPLLMADEVEKEKTVILEEIKMYRDQPQAYVYELLDELLWPDQPLGAPIIGTPESVSAVKREALDDFREKYYQAGGVVISAAGKLSHSSLVKDIAGIFTQKKTAGQERFSLAEERQDRPQLKISVKETEQTHLALGFHAFRRDHPLRHAQGILHIILGGNMSSRLFNELREDRGLAYEIGTGVKRFHDTGAFLVHAGIDNRKVSEAIGLILKELKKIKEELVSADEFKRAKEFYCGQFALSLEDTLDHMLWIGETTATLDRAFSLKEIIEEINRVKIEDVRRASRVLFDEKKLNLALIGPLYGKETELSSQLKIG